MIEFYFHKTKSYRTISLSNSKSNTPKLSIYLKYNIYSKYGLITPETISSLMSISFLRLYLLLLAHGRVISTRQSSWCSFGSALT